jgi:hypothetical protein
VLGLGAMFEDEALGRGWQGLATETCLPVTFAGSARVRNVQGPCLDHG